MAIEHSTTVPRRSATRAPGMGKHDGEADSAFSRCTQRTSEMIEHNPVTAMGVALGVGFGIGVMIGAASGGAMREKRHIDRSAAEKFGRRVLDAMHDALPKSLSRHLG